eukprot:CAMPEP_0182421264 /NCGR_PEP_ID=MMETSP1167-20130531/6576_1 /TAXON_ID=2988 /ORGANISM="Mallomonas Sp, Strain CCMP3275" /LENGTH=518 /DNA_ID=CAMNT_0024598219 /DNA_START=110 /DNA_END=1666 /DNA_ORIENTATION=-
MSSDLKACEYIAGRVYYVPLSASPSTALMQKHHFFSIDQELVYWNFFYDFGPLNLGHLYRFCTMLNNKLADPKLKEKIIYFYSGSHAHKKANASFLISAWAILYMNRTPEEAFRPVRGLGLPLWHDATNTVCSFQLTVLDTLKGLDKARKCNFFDFQSFDIDEYEYFEQVENGDLNWCMDGKFIAFAGPHASKESLDGYRTLTPDDYVPYFKRKNVTLVVRLNKKYYDAKRFTMNGIDHMELYYLDGSVPTFDILNAFLVRCEETPGAVAVHCKAGLGRTGTCIGAYMMKHFHFTAEECIGWLRIVRPGSVIGPQQQYMKDMQARLWREGESYRERMGGPGVGMMPPGRSPNAVRVMSDEGASGSERDSSSSSGLPATLFSGVNSLSLNSRSNPASRQASSNSTTPLPLIRSSSGKSAGDKTPPSAEAKGKEHCGTDSKGMPQLIRGSSVDSTSSKEATTQGDHLRVRRQQIANEQAAKNTVKITSPPSPTGSSPSTPGSSGSRTPGFTSRFLSSWRK